MTLCVVIPAYNAAETLAEALDSLLAQTRGDWTAIIVDDGSTDGTRQLAETYVARDKRFRLLSDGRPREGVSAARNRGIAVAQGRWLTFLDADDWIDSGFVEKMIGALEAHPGARVVYCNTCGVTPDGRRGAPWLSSDVARSPFQVFARHCIVAIHSFVIDHALLDDVGGFDPSLHRSEDWDLWQRIARTGTPFLPVPDAFAFYRSRQKSLSRDVRPMLVDSRIVIERGFGPDPRVRHPDPRHAAGADPGMGGTKEMAIAQVALWTAAFEVAEGGDGKDLIEPLPDLGGGLLEACRQNILDGLMCGARTLMDGPYSDDPAFLAAVRRLLTQTEQATGRPGLARLLEFVLEPEIFKPAQLTERLVTGRAMFLRVDIDHLQPIEAPPGVDTLHVEFRSGLSRLARAEVPLFGTLSIRELTAIAIEAMSLSIYLKTVQAFRRPGFWWRVILELARLPAQLGRMRPRRGPKSAFRPRALARKVMAGASVAAAGPPTSASNEQGLKALTNEGRAQAMAATLPAPLARPVPQLLGGEARSARGRPAYWDAVYRTPDPWDYGSPYEQLKYQRTLSMVPTTPIKCAMEVGCSEGRFSAMLAPRVEQLVASDISPTALGRAEARCRDLTNVQFRQLDFFDAALPRDLDLLVCSEVLYHLADRAELARVAASLAAALAPGGHLLSAHAHLLKDDSSRTGFDWDSPFGARVIAETFAATPGLALEGSLQTELYRIDLWRRLTEGETPPAPNVETVELGPPPEPAYAASIVWDGAEMRRAEAQLREITEYVPVLMYHRVATEGPADLARYRTTPAAFAEQMRWLRRNGYHAVSSSEIAGHLAGGRPFQGRPVLISFDDGYRDFIEAAWPILRAHDFRAEVMVVTDRVGGTADWDVQHGAPAPLMGWPEIQALALAGIRFGSHMASHSHMAELSTREIALEAARSQAVIERALGEPCLSIAAPFGEASDRFVRIAAGCGYKVGFTVDPGFASLGSDPLRLPRIEVLSGWSIEAFASAVRPATLTRTPG